MVVPKPCGKVQICVDLTQLNKSICKERYPLPAVEQIFSQLAGTIKLHANSSLWQIPLAPESTLLTTLITPFGCCCFHRLPFGIISAPEYFQHQMAQILKDLDGVVCLMDDFLLYENTRRARSPFTQCAINYVICWYDPE